MVERRITDNILELKRVLPARFSQALDKVGHHDDLLEIVLDLGRIPSARYIEREVPLMDRSFPISAPLTPTTAPAWSAPCTGFRRFATAGGTWWG
jgi:hypothetical protein